MKKNISEKAMGGVGGAGSRHLTAGARLSILKVVFLTDAMIFLTHAMIFSPYIQ